VTAFYALSLGAGQVSTALAIAIADRLVVDGYDFGQFAPLGSCTFADTGGELRATYEHVERLGQYLAPRGVRLDVVRRDGLPLRERVLARAGFALNSSPVVAERIARLGLVDEYGRVKSAPAIPFHLVGGDSGRAQQHCTRDHKGRPIDRNTKKLARAAGKLNDVEVLIGYGIDEVDRMRNDTPEEWPEGWRWRYPLIEAKLGRGWAQRVCRAALGYVPESSACSFCPHRPDVGPGSRAWIKENEPDTYREVVEFDAAIRNGYGGLRAKCFLSALRHPVEVAIESEDAQSNLFPTCGRENGRCFT